MENATYVSLGRQTGLMAEMRAVANNIANLSTTGFRKEGVVFAEHVVALGADAPSLSVASGNARHLDLGQGPLQQTGGIYDFAIEGEGFFLVQGSDRAFLTRAGAFTLSPEGEVVTADGLPLLDAGQAPVSVPAGAREVSLSGDGVLSADGAPVAQIGVFVPVEASGLTRSGATRFAADGGVEAAGPSTLRQGFLEGSNVNPVLEIARMIDVQRAYEMGQGFLDREDARIRSVIQAAAG